MYTSHNHHRGWVVWWSFCLKIVTVGLQSELKRHTRPKKPFYRPGAVPKGHVTLLSLSWGTRPRSMPQKSNTLPTWGNEASMNLNPLILTNIQSSPYFKNELFKLKTYHEVVDEIYYRVRAQQSFELKGHLTWKHSDLLSPSVTARVKISQNVDIHAKVYLVHWKVEHRQTLHVASTFTGHLKWVNCFWLVKSIILYCWGWSKWQLKPAKKCPCLHIWVNSQNRQLTNFDHYSYLPLKCSYSKMV